MAGNFSSTMTAVAFVLFAAAMYFGLWTKVSCPGTACSMPQTPEISASGEAFSRRACRAVAMSESFMVGSERIVMEQPSALSRQPSVKDIRSPGLGPGKNRIRGTRKSTHGDHKVPPRTRVALTDG